MRTYANILMKHTTAISPTSVGRLVNNPGTSGCAIAQQHGREENALMTDCRNGGVQNDDTELTCNSIDDL